jgi:glutamate formiminotransferase
MPLTVTFASTPNQTIHEGEFLGLKARRVTITFDNSYATAGEPLTAASLGWSNVVGFIPLTAAKNAAGTQAAVAHAVANAAQTQLNFFLYNENDAAAYAQRPKLAEAQAASDQSLFSVDGVLLGS